MSTNTGQRIRRLREERNMTQEELAHKVGYKSRASINKIELERDLPINKLIPIAEALNVDVKYLIGWEEKENRKPKLTKPRSIRGNCAKAKLIPMTKEERITMTKYRNLSQQQQELIKMQIEYLYEQETKNNKGDN